jgi:hypothetical protein
MTGEPKAFANVIPATPGWRLVELWGDSPDCPEPHFEPVIAWAELPDDPGCLVPLQRAGWANPEISPIDKPGDSGFELDFFFALLAPGEDLDLGDEVWAPRVAAWFKQQKNARRKDSVVRS